MASVVDILGRPFTPPEPKKPESPERQLIDAMADAGLTPPERVVIDGHLHRWSSSGKPKDDTGWYVAFPGAVTAGQFGDWRTGISVPWRADIGRELSQAEQMALARHTAEARRLRDIEQAKKRESAADTAEAIWAAATPAHDDHPYLVAKRVPANGLRVTGDGRLVCPMYADGELSSLQFIDADGGKRFLPGGKTAGAVFLVGSLDGAISVYVCEGVATAATIHAATGQPVIVAYSASNLTAAALWGQDFALPLTIVADNDESGTGQREGKRASEAANARLVIPPVLGQDANDFAQSGGDLIALLSPPAPTGWLISADDFSREPAPIRWLIKGWLPRESLAMLHGPSGGGKTFAVLDWCCRIASGMSDWCGHIVRPGPVVYLAGEGHHGLKGRVAAWKAHHSNDHLRMWISASGTDLNRPDGYTYANEAIKALPESPVLIVVDTLHRHYSGNENDPQDVKTMLDACAALQRDYKAAVLLVHHTGVSDEAQHRGRGSSSWRGALETEISVVPGTDGGPIEIISRKSKDTAEPASKYLTITSVPLPWVDEDGEPVTSAVLVEASAPATSSVSITIVAARQRFERALFRRGMLYPSGVLYVSTEGWKESERLEDYPSDSARQKAMQRDKKTLLASGVIVEHDDGYKMADGQDKDIVSILMKSNKTMV